MQWSVSKQLSLCSVNQALSATWRREGQESCSMATVRRPQPRLPRIGEAYVTMVPGVLKRTGGLAVRLPSSTGRGQHRERIWSTKPPHTRVPYPGSRGEGRRGEKARSS